MESVEAIVKPNLRERVILDQQTQSVDPAGNIVTSWYTVATVHAEVVRKAAKEAWLAGRSEGLRTHEVTIRWRGDVGTNNRLYWRDRLMDIIGVLNKDGQRQWLTLLCTERKADEDAGPPVP